MSAQDLEQRARELLAAEWERDGFSPVQAQDIRDGYVTNTTATAIRAIVAALRQQPAPVDLEQFRLAVAAFKVVATQAKQPDAIAEANRLLSIIELCPCGEATCTESWEPGCGLGESVKHAVPAEREPPRGDELRAILAHQPAPVVDDAMVELGQCAKDVSEMIRLRSSRAPSLNQLRRWHAALTAALARAQGVQS